MVYNCAILTQLVMSIVSSSEHKHLNNAMHREVRSTRVHIEKQKQWALFGDLNAALCYCQCTVTVIGTSLGIVFLENAFLFLERYIGGCIDAVAFGPPIYFLMICVLIHVFSECCHNAACQQQF